LIPLLSGIRKGNRCCDDGTYRFHEVEENARTLFGAFQARPLQVLGLVLLSIAQILKVGAFASQDDLGVCRRATKPTLPGLDCRRYGEPITFFILLKHAFGQLRRNSGDLHATISIIFVMHRERQQAVALLLNQSDVLLGLRIAWIPSAALTIPPRFRENSCLIANPVSIPRAEDHKAVRLVHE
jgi:hypothetical protein